MRLHVCRRSVVERPFVICRKHACLAMPCCCLCFSKDGMSTQTALDRTEGAKPSSSQSAQPELTTNHASTSDGAADSSKPKQKQKKQKQQPVAQLLEDQGLNAELDAANTGLVETERDRLIRIVRTQLSSARVTYFAHCGITPALEIARNCKVPHTLLTTVPYLQCSLYAKVWLAACSTMCGGQISSFSAPSTHGLCLQGRF